jgi:hypothetical protein
MIPILDMNALAQDATLTPLQIQMKMAKAVTPKTISELSKGLIATLDYEKKVGKKIVPYDTRASIEKNPNNKNLEAIAYVDDKIDLFFLQVQGSGKIQLDTGEILNVGYAGQNVDNQSSLEPTDLVHYLSKVDQSPQTSFHLCNQI